MPRGVRRRGRLCICLCSITRAPPLTIRMLARPPLRCHRPLSFLEPLALSFKSCCLLCSPARALLFVLHSLVQSLAPLSQCLSSDVSAASASKNACAHVPDVLTLLAENLYEICDSISRGLVHIDSPR